MILRENLPVGAVGGACFVSGRMPATGERVIDCEVEMEARNPYGRVCITEEIVKEMARMIGWVEYDPTAEQRRTVLRDHIEALTAERDALRAVFITFMDAARLVNIDLPGWTAPVEQALNALDRVTNVEAVKQ